MLIYPADEVPEHSVVKLCSRLWAINPGIEIMLSTSFGMKKKSELCLEQLRGEFKECSFSITLAEESSGNSFDKAVHFCRHVKDITENILPDIYIDIYGNMIADEQDYIYFRNYEKSYEFFMDYIMILLLRRSTR